MPRECRLRSSRCCREEYYGLRVRQVKDPSVAINIPVNTTIGPSGLPCQPFLCPQGHAIACFGAEHDMHSVLLHLAHAHLPCCCLHCIVLLGTAAKSCPCAACRVFVSVLQEPPERASLPHREHVE